MDYLLIGKISKPHGLNGEVKIYSKTDFASTRYKIGNVVYFFYDNQYKPLIVNSFYHYKEFDIVSFKDYLSINLVTPLLGKDLYIKKIDAILPKNHYHYVDLINLKIINEGKEIGIVKNVLSYPANDILRCQNKSKTFDIPFVDEYILDVNLEKKEIKVKLIEGIL